MAPARGGCQWMGKWTGADAACVACRVAAAAWVRWLRSTPPPVGRGGEAPAPGRGGYGLDLADQVQRRSDGLGAFLPLGRADLARVGGDELGSLQLAQGLGDVAGDGVVVDLEGLDHAFRVDDEGAAQGQAFFLDVHAEGAGQLVGRVA